MKKYVHLILFITCLLLLVYCNKSNETYKAEIKNGIKIIENLRPKWGDESRITLEFVRKIGGLDTQDENYMFYMPLDLVQDAKGNKYVLDRGEFRIRKFDSNWKYIKRFVRRGQGPGEVSSTSGLAINSHSNIYLFDRGNMRVQILDSDGIYKKSIWTEHQSYGGSVQSSGRVVLTKRSFHSRSQGLIDSENPTMLSIVDLDGKIIEKFVECKILDEYFLMYGTNNVSFDIDVYDNIYVTFHYQNRIEKYSPDGKPIFFSKRPLKYKIKQRVVLDNGYTEPIFTYISNDIRIDGKGRLWVTTYDEQPESQGSRGATLKNRKWLKFEIYDKEGVLLGEIPTPIEFYKKRIYGDTLYLIDPYFEACIYEYKIIEKDVN